MVSVALLNISFGQIEFGDAVHATRLWHEPADSVLKQFIMIWLFNATDSHGFWWQNAIAILSQRSLSVMLINVFLRMKSTARNEFICQSDFQAVGFKRVKTLRFIRIAHKFKLCLSKNSNTLLKCHSPLNTIFFLVFFRIFFLFLHSSFLFSLWKSQNNRFILFEIFFILLICSIRCTRTKFRIIFIRFYRARAHQTHRNKMTLYWRVKRKWL